MRISALDHTLGHSPERRNLVFSMEDRLAIVHRLDGLGIDYVEAGSPFAEPVAREFFIRANDELPLAHAQLVASVRLESIRESVEADAAIRALLEAGTPVVSLAGCCWDAGPIGFQEYCRRIGESVRHLIAHQRSVIFRAEDFFDAYRTDPSFALHMLEAAKSAGAGVLCLCDSAGGTLPQVVREVCLETRKRFDGVLGIRAQDDSGLAVANALEAVAQGFTLVEGCLAGSGSGNTNLSTVIANLEYKLGHTVLEPKNLERLPTIARFVAQAGMIPVRRETAPSAEGLLATVDERLRSQLGVYERRGVLDRILLLEAMGYDLRTAHGTLELLVRETLHPDLHPFEAERYELAGHSALYGAAVSTATATVHAGDAVRSESEEGAGPVDALERSLRQCLFAIYPSIGALHMREYHIRAVEPERGGASRVRAAIDWSETGEQWTTAAVSEDLIEAVWLALVDGFRLLLMRLGERGAAELPAADSSWAV